jgi:hypothetical protein
MFASCLNTEETVIMIRLLLAAFCWIIPLKLRGKLYIGRKNQQELKRFDFCIS